MIRRNKIVFLDMTVLDNEGHILESTDGSNAFSYLHGRGNLLPVLEEALDGQDLGFETCIDVTADQAFGAHDPALCIEVPADCLQDTAAAVGQMVQAQGPHGPMNFTIVEVRENSLLLDANHPLAGRDLTFLIKVLAVRDAHKDEVKHRRPHPAGHHLMVSDSSWWEESPDTNTHNDKVA